MEQRKVSFQNPRLVLQFPVCLILIQLVRFLQFSLAVFCTLTMAQVPQSSATASVCSTTPVLPASCVVTPETAQWQRAGTVARTIQSKILAEHFLGIVQVFKLCIFVSWGRQNIFEGLFKLPFWFHYLECNGRPKPLTHTISDKRYHNAGLKLEFGTVQCSKLVKTHQA